MDLTRISALAQSVRQKGRFTLAPATADDAREAGKMLNRLFGSWRNSVRLVSLGNPASTPRALVDYANLRKEDALLYAYLPKHFGLPTWDRNFGYAKLSVDLTARLFPYEVEASYPRLPPHLAKDASESLRCLLTYATYGACTGKTGDDIDALYGLCELLPRVAVVCRTESFGSGHRRWVAVTA